METNLSFWWDLESFDKNVCPVTRFFAVETILSFGKVLENFRQKGVASYTFLAVQTILSFWWDLEKFSQNVCPVTRFGRCGDYLKFLDGT